MSEQYGGSTTGEYVEPVIKRINSWEIDGPLYGREESSVLVKAQGSYIGLDVVPVATELTLDASEQPAEDPEIVRQQRLAVAEAVGKVLGGQVTSEATAANASGAGLWVGFSGLRTGDKLSTAMLSAIEETPDGTVVVKVIDKENALTVVPAGQQVVLLSERHGKAGGYSRQPRTGRHAA